MIEAVPTAADIFPIVQDWIDGLGIEAVFPILFVLLPTHFSCPIVTTCEDREEPQHHSY